jgi:hypothetical protein
MLRAIKQTLIQLKPAFWDSLPPHSRNHRIRIFRKNVCTLSFFGENISKTKILIFSFRAPFILIKEFYHFKDSGLVPYMVRESKKCE